MTPLFRLALVLGLLVAVGCDGDDDDDKAQPGCTAGAAGSGGAPGCAGSVGGSSSGGSGDGYPTSGCLRESGCVTNHAPLTQEQIDSSEATCTQDGGTVLTDETCPRSETRGCCLSGAAGVRITTCVYADPQDEIKKGCDAQGGVWSTSL